MRTLPFTQTPPLKVVNDVPLPLVKICDFGCSKADAASVAKTKVHHKEILPRLPPGNFTPSASLIWREIWAQLPAGTSSPYPLIPLLTGWHQELHGPRGGRQ